MKLSLATSYAITALVHLAREKADGLIKAHKVARSEGVPTSLLRKALKPLVDAGVLRCAPGSDGGDPRARPPKDVTLLEVIEAVAGPLPAMAEPVVGAEGEALGQRLQAVCDEALAVVRERLEKVTLAEVAGGK